MDRDAEIDTAAMERDRRLLAGRSYLEQRFTFSMLVIGMGSSVAWLFDAATDVAASMGLICLVVGGISETYHFQSRKKRQLLAEKEVQKRMENGAYKVGLNS